MSDGLLDPSAIVNNGLQNPLGQGLQNGEVIGELSRQHQREQDLQRLSEKHSPQDILNLTLKYPELTDHIKSAFEGMDANEQKRRIDQTIPIYSAALAGRMDVAKKMLEKQALALENSNGDPEEISRMRDMAQLAIDDPESFKNYAGMSLAHGMGADNFGKTWVDEATAENKSALTPYQQYSEQAKGNKDQAAAAMQNAILPYAADTAAAELQNKQYQLTDTKADNRTNALQVASSLETNQLKRLDQQQTMDIKAQERGQKQIDAAQAFETANSALDGITERIDEALADPVLKANPIQRAAFSSLPGSPYLSFKKKLETVQTMNLIPTLAAAKAAGWTGSMSDKDMEMLKSEIDSLDTSIDSKDLEKHLNKIKTMMGVAKVRSAKYAKQSEKIGALPAGTVQPISPRESISKTLLDSGASPDEIEQYLNAKGY